MRKRWRSRRDFDRRRYKGPERGGEHYFVLCSNLARVMNCKMAKGPAKFRKLEWNMYKLLKAGDSLQGRKGLWTRFITWSYTISPSYLNQDSSFFSRSATLMRNFSLLLRDVDVLLSLKGKGSKGLKIVFIMTTALPRIASLKLRFPAHPAFCHHLAGNEPAIDVLSGRPGCFHFQRIN
jgi:hypothetical protein